MIFLTQFTIRFSEITVIFKNKPPAIGNFSDCGLSFALQCNRKDVLHTTQEYFI